MWLEAAFEAGSVALLQVEPCTETVTRASGSVRGILGLEPGEVEGRRLTELSADGVAGLDAAMASVVGKRTRVELGDHRFRRAGGGAEAAEVWLSLSCVGLPECTDVCVTCIDVTDRVVSERALEEKRARLELVLEGTRLGMWDWNPQTNEVQFNERWAEMLGHRLDEIPFELTSWESRVHPEDLQACYADIQAHMAGEVDFYENVHRMRHKDGSWRYILDRGTIVQRDAEGRPTRFTGTHTDITDQKRAEEEAKAGLRAKSMFLARMSHEIRTPLNGVLGTLQLLATTDLNEEQSGYVGVIRRCGEGLLTVINDVLDLAKGEAGRLRLSPETFSPRTLLQTVHELFRETATKKELAYPLVVGEEVPKWLRGDRHRIRQIVLNLLSNALKFTERGRVEVRAAWTGERLEIDVVDTGIGIANPSRLFVPFQQDDGDLSRRFGGTGLGLSISRQWAELMGGRIDVESEKERGSRFRVSLPLEVAAEGPGVERLAATGTNERRRVLLAEDNPVNRMVAERMLLLLGAHVVVATDGGEAVAQAEAGAFDLIFMDLHMPVMNGIDATHRIRELLGDAAPPIVALTADAFEESREACVDAGMVGMIAKPVRMEQLREVLEDPRKAAR
jgi:PAS domain S-box-containing protein